MRVLICCSINWERSLRTSVLVGLCLTLAGGGVLGACSSGKDLQTLPTSGVFDYQLGGGYSPVDGRRPNVVVRDVTDSPEPRAYSICYINGFQTQPLKEAEFANELVLTDSSGTPITDPDWPDEQILDPSTESQREGILAVIGPKIDACAAKGFDAVEIDNLDTFTRFEQIDRAGTIALATSYATRAHDAGLAIGQKNTLELGHIGKDQIGFDFAITESCAVYDECSSYRDTYGPHVLQIEYDDELAEAGMTFEDVCSLPSRAPLTILRDHDLVPFGSPSYLYERCSS